MEEKMADLMNLETEKERLQEDKEVIVTELQEKEALLEIEMREKNKLEEILNEMNSKLVSGGEALEVAEQEVAKREREHSLILKKQRKEKKKLRDEMEDREEKMFEMN